MKEAVKRTIGKVLFELTIVSFGVLLALAANAKYQGYQQQQQAGNFLKKIHYEIKNNLESVEKVNSDFSANIQQTNQYLSELNTGNAIDASYSISILAIDFAVWKYIQHRQELDQLPVDLLIAVSESYRALESADELTQELAFSKLESIMDGRGDKEQTEALNSVLWEMKQVKFHLELAQIKLEHSIELIAQYQQAS